MCFSKRFAHASLHQATDAILREPPSVCSEQRRAQIVACVRNVSPRHPQTNDTNLTRTFFCRGKYTPQKMKEAVASLPNRTMLALSSRGMSYGGYSSELFGMDRILLQHSLNLWTDVRNTESFVARMRSLVLHIDKSTVTYFPKLNLKNATRRYSDKRLLTFL